MKLVETAAAASPKEPPALRLGGASGECVIDRQAVYQSRWFSLGGCSTAKPNERMQLTWLIGAPSRPASVHQRAAGRCGLGSAATQLMRAVSRSLEAMGEKLENTTVGSAIILIGPVRAGKSTIGSRLATSLAVPFYELDDLRFGYYNEIGYDTTEAKRRIESEGFWGLYRYWKPFEAYAVERLLSEHQTGVISFGAGHSVYEDDALFQRVQAAMAPFPRVVLLLPSPDIAVTIKELRSRDTDAPVTEPDINEHFVRHHSNYDLAKEVVYTLGQTPEETCEEIRRRFDLQAR